MPDMPVFTGAATTQPALPPSPPSVPAAEQRRENLAMWLQFPRRALFLVIALFLTWTLAYFVSGVQSQIPEELALQIMADPALRQLTPEQRQELLNERVKEYMDQPPAARYFRWLGGVLTGYMGRARFMSSDSGSRMIGNMIAERLPNTLFLWGTGLALALLQAAAGVAAALLLHRLEGRRGPLGSVLKGLGRLLVFPPAAAPAFCLGLSLLLVFAAWLGLLPFGGMQSSPPSPGDVGDIPRHLLLPALALPALPAALIAQAVAREVTLPRARGGWRVWVGGMLRGLGTCFGLTGLWLSLLVLVETVFRWPGIGQWVLMAVGTNELQVLLGLVVVMSLLVLLGRLLAELFRWLERMVRLAPLSPPPEPTPWRKKARRIYVIIALALLALPLLLSLAGLAVDPNIARMPSGEARFLPPSAAHPLGTDHYGRDMGSLTARGTFTSVGTALLVGAVLLVPAALGGALTGWLASRQAFWRESLADLVLLPGDVLLLIPALPAVVFLRMVLPLSGWLAALLLLAVVLLPRAVRAGQALWLAAPEPRRPLLLILGGGGALLLGTAYTALTLHAGLDFLGLSGGTPSLGAFLSDALVHGYIYTGYGSMLVLPILILGLCATVFYTAADALVGYFQDKGVMARLNE